MLKRGHKSTKYVRGHNCRIASFAIVAEWLCRPQVFVRARCSQRAHAAIPTLWPRPKVSDTGDGSPRVAPAKAHATGQAFVQLQVACPAGNVETPGAG
jgi:hypothetical protein